MIVMFSRKFDIVSHHLLAVLIKQFTRAAGVTGHVRQV